MNGTHRSTVYLLHGLLGTAHHHFAPQVRAWKDELTVVPLDLPGHGRCSLDAQPHYIATAIRYTLAIMGRFGPGYVIAASYLGGPVAVRCALDRPEHVHSLVLTGFVPDIPLEVFKPWLEGFGRLAAENQELARWYEKTHGPRWLGTLAAYTEDVHSRYAEELCVTKEMLSRLPQPTLLLNGSAKSNERTAALNAHQFGPSMRGHVAEGAGHFPSQDRPDEFDAAVHAFWNECAFDTKKTAC